MKVLGRINLVASYYYVQNEDIRYIIYAVRMIVEKLLDMRLRWYGNVFCADENSLAKIGLNIQPTA